MITATPPALSIEKSETLSPELLTAIEEVVWGFDAGVRYKIFERQAMLERLVPPGHFLLLRKNRSLVGTLFCLPKNVSDGNSEMREALYLSVLSVRPEEGGQGHAKRLIQAAGAESSGVMEYAYIEALNHPSAAAFKAQGYQELGQFHAVIFNRLRPQLSSRVQSLDVQRLGQMKELLSNLYQGHALCDFDESFQSDHYFVVMDQGKILAGIQLEEEFWSIVSMPGPDGWIAVKILPHLPLLSAILNPVRIPIIKIGNLYVPPGGEEAFMELVEHLTRQYQKKLALAYLDKRSPVYQRLKKSLSFGCFNPLFETPVSIWARGLDPKEWNDLQEKPFVISPLDIS